MQRAFNTANTGGHEKKSRCPVEQRRSEMFSKKFIVTSLVSIASMALPAFSQSETPGKNEVSVQAFGSFVKSTTNNGIDNPPPNSTAVLAPYPHFFITHTP